MIVPTCKEKATARTVAIGIYVPEGGQPQCEPICCFVNYFVQGKFKRLIPWAEPQTDLDENCQPKGART